ncbi:cidABC operon transcriptional activator CidR [Paenibacillus ginsengarvi]|uniref:LysR family transcriptional regulator n=1 Tax=Paenibacillus ginsengarvi TaxID=400777 RepID=A0A3B0BDH9_9BACL|nr:LysR family transcriptional regulator [Paenibacillus ginsengarvi]RKN71205.1 LysR family transcriptional regulator [Paenibacillus ginsengarvi]
MDIRHLKYFMEVVRYRSFTKAADSLHVTQPTISKMVKSIEEELGVVLLDRSGKHVVPTDAGEAMLQQAQLIVNAFDSLSSDLADIVQLKKGKIRIGLPPMAGARFFPKVIGEFRRQYPLIRLELIEDGAKKIAQNVESGSLDIGVVVLPTDGELFDSFAFVRENLMLLVHPAHPLASAESVPLQALKEEPFLLFRDDFALHDRIPAACIEAGFQPNVVFESSQWDFISEMVAADLGIAMLPETICRHLDYRRIAAVKLTPPGIPWHLAMIWRKEAYMSYALKEWIRFAKEKLAPGSGG